MALPNAGGSDPEKTAQKQNDVQQGNAETATSKPPEIAEHDASIDHFGDEDHEYITGYKLYSALFGIVSVFFIVLLDFSITATVSTDSL